MNKIDENAKTWSDSGCLEVRNGCRTTNAFRQSDSQSGYSVPCVIESADTALAWIRDIDRQAVSGAEGPSAASLHSPCR